MWQLLLWQWKPCDKKKVFFLFDIVKKMCQNVYVEIFWPLVICHCEIGNIFFFNTDLNTLQKFWTVIKYYLIKKNAFGNDLDLGKCPNQEMHESESTVFSPMSEIISESSFLIKSYIVTVVIFLWRVLVRLKRIKENGFSILISKMGLVNVGVIFTSVYEITHLYP